MKTDALFVRAARVDIVPALLGQLPDRDQSGPLRSIAGLGKDELGFIYEDERAQLPAAVVLHRDNVDDFFAWLETYAPQFFPLTQSCRVVTPELSVAYDACHVVSRNSLITRALSGVVVGEVIAQTAQNPVRTLENANMSHANATFSFSLSKAELLKATDYDCRRDVLGGLELLVRAGLVGDRLLAPSDLFPFWGIAFGGSGKEIAGHDLSSALRGAIEDLTQSGLSSSSVMKLARFYEPARELMNLHDFSAEERVHRFDKLIGNSGFGSDTPANFVEDFCLAYAAVEIGGGSTRHIGLLQEYGERRPLVWLWFGFLASLGRDDKWHPAFARFGRLVQRELQYTFEPWDAPRTDISLQELLAVKRSRASTSWSSAVPRAHARYLSVELAPGVPFQIAVAGTDRKEGNPSSSPSFDVARLDQVLSDLWSIRQSVVQEGGKVEGPASKGSRRSPRVSKAKKGDLF